MLETSGLPGAVSAGIYVHLPIITTPSAMALVLSPTTSWQLSLTGVGGEAKRAAKSQGRFKTVKVAAQTRSPHYFATTHGGNIRLPYTADLKFYLTEKKKPKKTPPKQQKTPQKIQMFLKSPRVFPISLHISFHHPDVLRYISHYLFRSPVFCSLDEWATGLWALSL